MPHPPQEEAQRTEGHVPRMFDRIAHRYDLLNRLLSFRRDVAWRKAMLRHLPAGEGLAVLDLATGTGDVLVALCGDGARVLRGVGLDPSAGMLRIAVEKCAARGLSGKLRFLLGDATCLGLRSERFDVVTIAFGIRNVPDVGLALREMLRVLKPGGRALVLEFSMPGNRLFRALYLLYFRHFLPRLGGMISGDRDAYAYLNRTVEAFPSGDAFCALMTEAGFGEVRAYPLTFGIATLYVGSRE